MKANLSLQMMNLFRGRKPLSRRSARLGKSMAPPPPAKLLPQKMSCPIGSQDRYAALPVSSPEAQANYREASD